jgi:hypothetical protein
MRKSKIFEVSNEIPAIHVHPKGKKPEAHEATLKEHHNSGGHEGHMDHVNRGSHPEAHELETDIMGN